MINTHLSIAEWASILGYNRWHFFGLGDNLNNRVCNDDVIWYQSPGLNSAVSRDEVNLAIYTAEKNIEKFVGFNLVPSWNEDSIFIKPNYRHPPINQKVRVERGYVHAGGFRKKDYVERAAKLEFVDRNKDGLIDTAEVTYQTSLKSAIHQIRVFYPDTDVEIKPVTYKAGKILIPLYLLVDPIVYETQGKEYLRANEVKQYIDNVDIARIYTSKFNEAARTKYYGNSGIEVYNSKQGYVTNCRFYDSRTLVNYYSGWVGDHENPYYELDPRWKIAITYYSASLLNNRPCVACEDGVAEFVSRWSDHLTEKEGFITPDILENILGVPTLGALYAYKQFIRYKLR